MKKGDKVELIESSTVDKFIGVKVGDVGECVSDTEFKYDNMWIDVKFENIKSIVPISCNRLKVVSTISNFDYLSKLSLFELLIKIRNRTTCFIPDENFDRCDLYNNCCDCIQSWLNEEYSDTWIYEEQSPYNKLKENN